MDVSDRLVARRARLQPFCHVDPVKHHLRLQSYYQVARQLYRQSEVYYQEGEWDNAYVLLAKFIKLCSKVITSHRDYNLAAYKKERDWVRNQAADGFKLFDAILDGMEAEELEYIEYERSLEEETKKNSNTVHNEVGKPTQSLEERLQVLRVTKRPTGEQAASTEPRNLEDAAPKAEIVPNSGVHLSSLPTAWRTKEKKKSVAYPKVGKPSWSTTTGDDKLDTRLLPPLLSRQRSQEAFANLTSGRIRILEIPTSIIAQFTQLAAPNTNKPPYGIETCGILAGVLRDRRLIITTLVIPKQEGSSDMCNMTNEEDLYDFCFHNDLLTLGWIHTHPKQTCFLSSVDIHTQCGFQSMLPEAVAIVVAPNDPNRNVGVFRLTEPHGLQLIQNCNLTGFHTHPTHVEIYSDAIECTWKQEIAAQLIDMRGV